MAQQNASILAGYEQLLSRATSKFNKIIDNAISPTPSQQAAQFTRTFAVYNELWKYQQQHRCFEAFPHYEVMHTHIPHSC